MVLYIWIDSYRNLKNIGFNVSSKFDFQYHWELINRKISGNLIYQKTNDTKLFNTYLKDFKAIIGKNGTGKSSVIFSFLDSVLSDYPGNFSGFIVTDKYIFNRSGIEIKNEVSIDGKKLIEVKNSDICNFHRLKHEKHLTEEQAKSQKGYRIIDSFLRDYSIFYYCPLLNYDRIYEGEGAVSGNNVYEVDFYRYFDLSTEGMIHTDTSNFKSKVHFSLNTLSETLCHKSRESERILDYLMADEAIPFKINIPEITISLNQYETNFWEDVFRIFKSDDDNSSDIDEIFVRLSSTKMFVGWLGFREEFYKRMILSLLAIEVEQRYNFGNYGNDNPLTFSLRKFIRLAKKARTFKGLLKNYIENIDLPTDNFIGLYSQIKDLIDFLYQQHKKKTISVSTYGFTVDFNNKIFIAKFQHLTNRFNGLRGKEIFKIRLPIFSYDFSGLSSGEKSLLHFFSRFNNAFKFLEPETKNILIFLDEPEVGYHPQWQKTMVTMICTFFKTKLTDKGYDAQIILTGHSPIVISDLPMENIVFLDTNTETNKPYISHLTNIDNTFAANIHALYADAFFIQNGTIGEFAKAHIQKTVKILKDKDSSQMDYAQRIIGLIGDKLIRQRLQEMYSDAFNNQDENIDLVINQLEQELEKAKAKRNENRK
jgi:predicted ATPase